MDILSTSTVSLVNRGILNEAKTKKEKCNRRKTLSVSVIIAKCMRSLLTSFLPAFAPLEELYSVRLVLTEVASRGSRVH